MTGQQGGAPGQPGSSSPQDPESTQVGMPVPPAPPAYSQQPPQQPPTYGQAPGYPPPPPGYTGQPPAYGGQPPTYGGPPPGSPPPGGYPPTGYGYQTPPPKRGGPSLLVIGAIALAVVLVLGIGGMYAAGLGPFKPSATATSGAQLTPTPKPSKTPADSTPTPAASPAASPTAAPETTAPATTAPATIPPTAAATTPGFTLPPLSPGPSASMTDADTALLQHVPEEFRTSCSAVEAVQPALATLSCYTDFERGIFMSYSQYPDTPTMESAYNFQVQLWGGSDVANDQCSDTTKWPTELGYTVDEEPTGRLLCYELGESPQIRWTDTKLNILSWTYGLGDATKDDIYAFWDGEAGPY